MKIALEKLRQDYARRGEEAVYQALLPCLTESDEAAGYAEIAAQLGKSADAVKMAAKRLRERYADRFRAEIQETVHRPEEMEDEINQLLRIFSRRAG